MRFIYVCAILAAAPSVLHAQTVYRFDVVNASTSTIKVVAIAPAGGQVFRKAIDDSRSPVQLRGGESMTITTRPSEGGCLRDLRVSFDNGRELIERSFDICRREASYSAEP